MKKKNTATQVIQKELNGLLKAAGKGCVFFMW
jgi:hypothetical protein